LSIDSHGLDALGLGHIVIALVAIGLMTVCRPSRRLDKLDDKIKKEDE